MFFVFSCSFLLFWRFVSFFSGVVYCFFFPSFFTHPFMSLLRVTRWAPWQCALHLEKEDLDGCLRMSFAWIYRFTMVYQFLHLYLAVLRDFLWFLLLVAKMSTIEVCQHGENIDLHLLYVPAKNPMRSAERKRSAPELQTGRRTKARCSDRRIAWNLLGRPDMTMAQNSWILLVNSQTHLPLK